MAREKLSEDAPKRETANDAFVISEQTISMMARMPEFGFLKREDVANLAKTSPHAFKRGETIFSPSVGEEADEKSLVILLAGECRIEASVEVNGVPEWITIEMIHAPAVLGEVGVFSSRQRTARVIAAQRSVTLIVTAQTLKERFEKSGVPLPKALWSFAHLGFMRIKAGISQYTKLFRKYTGRVDAQPALLNRSLAKLETIMSESVEDSSVTEETFSTIARIMDDVDRSLALAFYFDNMQDHRIPDSEDVQSTFLRSISPLAKRTIEKKENEGKPIKSSVAGTCEENCDYCALGDNWDLCFENFIESASDVSNVIQLMREANSKRTEKPGAERMVDGFASRIEHELDKVSQKTTQRFSLDRLPEELRPRRDSDMIATYLQKKVADIKARISLFDFEHKGSDEYIRPGHETKIYVATMVYERLQNHPVVRIIIPKAYENMDMKYLEGDSKDHTILDFLSLGYYIIYPPEGKTGEEAVKERT